MQAKPCCCATVANGFSAKFEAMHAFIGLHTPQLDCMRAATCTPSCLQHNAIDTLRPQALCRSQACTTGPITITLRAAGIEPPRHAAHHSMRHESLPGRGCYKLLRR